MDPTAPLFLRYRPACLPIREPVLAIVGICWGWRLRRLSANVVNPAAPLLFGPIPGEVLAHSAVVWIHRSDGGWRSSGWRQGRRDGTRWRRRPRGRRGGRRRGEWRGRDCRRCLWQSCRRTTQACCHAAVVFLRLGPRPLDVRVAPSHPSYSTDPKTSLAIVRRRRRRSRQEPEKQGDQQ